MEACTLSLSQILTHHASLTSSEPRDLSHLAWSKDLSQRKYVLDLLSETGILACRFAETPIIQNHHLATYLDQVPIGKERY